MSFVNVKFPRLNKNSNLVENDKEIEYGSYVVKCKIARTLKVSNEVYNCLANEFMDNINDALYNQIGGCTSDAPELEGMDFFDVMKDENLAEIFNATCYRNVVEVVNLETNDKFYVNTEGYKYARYVGRLAD